MTPAVSVVISVKNRSALLWDCLTGLAAQTLPREQFEVVIIDNMSSEDLGPVFERGRRELGLTIRTARTTSDHGPAPARNMGVGMAQAPIIAFTDSDCRADPGWLAAMLPAFDSPDVAFATGPVRAKPGQVPRLTSKLTFATEEEHPTFPTANASYRRDLFLAFGGFDPTLSFRDPLDRATECADTDLAWRLLEAGHARRFVPEAVMYHEIEHQSLLMWVLEPTRLFVLPELVRRHPALRQKLLTAGLFFYPPIWLVYLGLLVVTLAGSMWSGWPLLVLPVLLLARGVVHTRGLNPVELSRFMGRTLAHLPRMIVMSASLLYGSARFRCLVL